MSRQPTPAFQRACAFLQRALAKGPAQPSALKRAARKRGVNPALLGLARRKLGIKTWAPDIHEQWWSLPDQQIWFP